MHLESTTKVDILLALFIASLIGANLLGSKITVFFGISVSVGIFAYPISFLITDIITEVFGKHKAKNFVLAGFLSLILIMALTYVSIKLPAANRYTYNNEYKIIFNASLRMIVASMVAFILAQLHDVWMFHKLKEKTHGKFLWLRNNISTIISQLIDTTLFMFIAFYAITPKFTASFIFALIIPYWLFKIAFAILDTPLVYLGVKWLKK